MTLFSRFLFALALTLTGSHAFANATMKGVFMVVKGDVKHTSAKTGQTLPAKIGKEVFPGDTLESGTDGRAKIVMADKNVINLSPGTKINIEKYENNGTDKNASINLLYGKVRADVKEKYDGEKSKFLIKTPSAVAGVRGTVPIVSFVNNQTKVQIPSGFGYVTQNPSGSIKGATMLPAGTQTTVSTTGQIAPPAQMSREEMNSSLKESDPDTASSNKEEPKSEVASDKKDEAKEEKKDEVAAEEKKDSPKEDAKKDDVVKEEPQKDGDKKEASPEKKDGDKVADKTEASSEKKDSASGDKKEPVADKKDSAQADKKEPVADKRDSAPADKKEPVADQKDSTGKKDSGPVNGEKTAATGGDKPAPAAGTDKPTTGGGDKSAASGPSSSGGDRGPASVGSSTNNGTASGSANNAPSGSTSGSGPNAKGPATAPGPGATPATMIAPIASSGPSGPGPTLPAPPVIRQPTSLPVIPVNMPTVPTMYIPPTLPPAVSNGPAKVNIIITQP